MFFQERVKKVRASEADEGEILSCLGFSREEVAVKRIMKKDIYVQGVEISRGGLGDI